MIQDVKSSPFILSAIPRIICNKCTLWTEEDALQNSFLCILSEYSLTKKENTSCFEPMPMRQLYIFGISIMEWVNQAIDDKNKWLLIQGKNACSIFSDVMRVWDLIFFFFLKIIKISFILKREKKNKKRSQRTDRQLWQWGVLCCEFIQMKLVSVFSEVLFPPVFNWLNL